MFANPLALLAQSHAPAFTHYDEQRLELGGKVVVNWLNKLANFYLEELALEPGQTVLLDLPCHWRTILWLQAGWMVGLKMRLSQQLDSVAALEEGVFWKNHPEISTLVTTAPEKYEAAFSSGCEVVGLELASLALKYLRPLPDFALDGNAAVLSQPDGLLFPVNFAAEYLKMTKFASMELLELGVEGQPKSGSPATPVTEGSLQALAGSRVFVDLRLQNWDIEELALLLFKLWTQGIGVLLIEGENQVKRLLEAEKVSLSLRKS